MNKDLISRQALIIEIMRRGIYPPEVRDAIENAPAIDAVPVVQCRECEYWRRYRQTMPDGSIADWGFCAQFLDADSETEITTNGTDFCSYGERKEAD